MTYPVPPQLVSEAEAAHLLGVKPEALARLRRAGRAPIPWARFGRFYKYARRDILDYLARGSRDA